MKYKDREGKVPFTVTPNEMYDKAMEMDTTLTTRRVLGWILKEIVSDNKKKVRGEWEIEGEGFTPKTWIARDLHISENDVTESIKELKERGVLDTETRPKLYKKDGKFYKRETTYCKIHDPKTWSLGKIKQIRADRGY